MKKIPFLFVLLVLPTMSMHTFANLPAGDVLYKISIKGVDHDFIHDGLKPSEFAEMTIECNDENRNIEAFEISLARGSRAISVITVEGNQFALQRYKSQARAGDRLVIEIKVGGNNELPIVAKQVIALRII